MVKKGFSITQLMNSNRFYLFLLCGVVLSFLFILISRLANIMAGTVATFAIPGTFLFIILFILPGLLTARQLIHKGIIDKKYLLLLSITFSSLIAYIVFWVYFFNNIAGRVVSVVIILSCLVIVLIKYRKIKDEILDEDFITPLTLMFLVGCLYLGILFLHYVGSYAHVANDRFVPALPVDNILPYVLLEMVYSGESLTYFFGDWLASDRPPLFSAMLLIVRPLAAFMDRSMFYQFVGTFMQCLWIPALYSLCKFFSFDAKIRNFIIGSTVFSGVFIINSTFLWPKFSATLFFALLFLMVFELSDKNKLTKKSTLISIIIGISAALAFLSHGGIAFSFIALGLAIIITEKRMNYIKHAIGALVPFFVLYFPWVLFQRFVAPPGNRLNKEHLAGVIGVNDYTFLEALYIGYSDRTIGHLINGRMSNFLFMFPNFPYSFSSLEMLRVTAFSRIFGTALILNIFLVILSFHFIKTYCLEQKPMSYRKKIMFYFTIFSFTVWPILMIAFNQTLIHQGSYVNILLVFILIAFGAKYSNNLLRNFLYISNIIIFAFLWVINTDYNIFQAPFVMSARMLIVTIVSAILFFIYLHKRKGTPLPEAKIS